MKHNIYVISAGRYDKLNFNTEQKSNYIFCVKKGEKYLYEKNGCKNVFETGTLMQSRNAALDMAFNENKICVQLSDDLKKVTTNKNFTLKKQVDIDFAIQELIKVFMKVEGVYLMGIPPTSNDFFAKSLISKNTFCIGDMLFIKPNDLRFDTSLTLKEDYDYTLQHLQKYKNCFRYQKYLFEFEHYKNKGGAVDYRTEQEEQKNIKILFAKWGNKIKLNPKRKNEILI
ncbi:MAG TPA: hypothetical protein VMZ91_00435 [Candidatus Paceibacterota bacterium]|nr:hypothetical protein [Candidatus Paceibacterota bacterium]